jgi:hypothetical protein
MAKEAANFEAFKQTQQMLWSSEYQDSSNIRNEVTKGI